MGGDLVGQEPIVSGLKSSSDINANVLKFLPVIKFQCFADLKFYKFKHCPKLRGSVSSNSIKG